MLKKALVANSSDNVATVVDIVEAGDKVAILVNDVVREIVAMEAVPKFHKIAMESIGKGNGVVKYGEIIGEASEVIGVGAYVHTHNVEGRRGRGDK